MVSLKDVAREAGVSIKTVSNVLNGKNKEIWPNAQKRANKIRDIAQKLGYQPNLNARAMRLKRTFQIGVLIDTISNPASAEVAETLISIFAEKGYRVLLAISEGNVDLSKSYLKGFCNGVVDGVISAEPFIESRTLEQFLGVVPGVIWNRESALSVSVQDYTSDFYIAMDHLWGLGHRRIGLLSPQGKDYSSNLRIQLYQSYLLNKGVRPEDKYIKYLKAWTDTDTYDKVKELVDVDCTAIIGGNDICAASAVHSLNSMHINVPQQVSVIGFDDSLAAKMCSPMLTTMRRPTYQLSLDAVQSLLGMIEGKNISTFHKVKSELVIRETTAKAL